ncbi:hypothetical protein IV203_023100 [Nitzschia inconspicua]|uniref:Uncharacterized protein n=1 Tax=Nitzschia inconspicua TaxID=303405 RepID=A0A9K3KCD8_9STRA|nr:hypothetical protein IV203_023100 [Nitzschia inconspicua]
MASTTKSMKSQALLQPTTTTTSMETLPDVKFFLSRLSYPLGGTVVGTVVIRRPPMNVIVTVPGEMNGDKRHFDDTEMSSSLSSLHSKPTKTSTSTVSLRDQLQSVTIVCAGFCKIDSRWHNVDDYRKIYGPTHPHLLQLCQTTFDADLLAQSSDTVCFWATNGMEALQLQERRAGRWKNIRTVHEVDVKDNVLAYTFRVDLPRDLPHSLHATTCKYYYVAHLLIKTSSQQQILKRPFLVTTDPYATAKSTLQQSQQQSSSPSMVPTTRVKFGTCLGMAHSNGLPCHLSASELARPAGQMTVKHNNNQNNTSRLANNHDCQTIQIRNSQGQPVCVLRVMGLQTATPGCYLHLEWQFDKHPVVPCYQVSACIQGEERAVMENGTSTRTRSILVDTCHDWVEPGITDTISKSLLLDNGVGINSNGTQVGMTEDGFPLCGLQTDLVHIRLWLQVDITVDGESSSSHSTSNNNLEYSNLSLQLPLHVRHELVDEDELIVEQEDQVMPLTELLGIEDDPEFPVRDIRRDLKNLARTMQRHWTRNETEKIDP